MSISNLIPHFTTDELNFARVVEGAFVALSTGFGAISVGYARIINKRSHRIENHTQTSVHVEGNLHVKSAADTAEEALNQAKDARVEITLLRQELFGSTITTLSPRPMGRRRAPTNGIPRVSKYIGDNSERSDSSNPNAYSSNLERLRAEIADSPDQRSSGVSDSTDH